MAMVKLGDVAIEKRETWTGSTQGVPIIGLEHLVPGEITLSSWDSDTDNTFSKMFRKDQVLLGRRRVYLKKAVIAPFDGICSGDITVIEAIPGKISPRLLPFIIQNERFFDYAIQGSAGSLSPRVKWEHLKDYEFNLSDYEEQESLANKLWSALKLKESYHALLLATDEMVKSRFIEMFGGNGASVKWPKAKLTEIVDPECPISYGIVQPDDDVKDGVPIVRPVDLNVGLYVKREGLKCTTPEISNAYKRTVLRGEELLLCVRGTTGLMGIATEELKGANVTRGITPLFFKPGINRIYVLGAFLSDDIQTYIKEHTIGSTLKGINMEKVRKIEIPVPPIALQNKYEQIFKQADKSKYLN